MDERVDQEPSERSEERPLDATSRAQLVARIAGHFMSIGPEEVDDGIAAALRAIGEFSGVDRTYAFRIDAEGTMQSTHEWCAPGIEPQHERLQDVPAPSMPWFYDHIRRPEVVHVPSVQDLPPAAAAERAEWQREGIQSLICVPLESAGTVIGFLGLDSVRRTQTWSERAVELLRSVGGILVGAINHQRAQRELVESRQYLVRAQDAASMGLWTWDVRTDRVTLSENACRIYGIDPQDFGGTLEAALSLLRPDDVPRARAELERSLREKRGLQFDFRIVRPGGGVRLLHAESHLHLDEDGEPDRVAGVIQDITERGETEAAERRLSAAIEQVADAVLITDGEGVILYVNPAFERITGHHRAQLLGRDRRFLRHASQDPEAYERIVEAVGRGEVWTGRVHVRRRDGSAALLDSTVSPVQDATGRIVHHVAVQRDVTREAALEEQLRQVQKMEAVGMLAGGIAHDFNNLLIAIIGHSDLLRMRCGNDEVLRRHVDEISKAGERAKALTSQLLAFSRKQVLQPRALDFGRVIGDLADLLRRVIGEDIELSVDLPAEPVVVLADPSQMEQVVLNLATNARDAMPAGGVLHMAVARAVPGPSDLRRLAHLEAKPYAVLTVRDSGMGMDERTRARIFEPFFTSKGVGEGTGLGLATVYGIVAQSGGTIDVESAAGQGSEFRVFLPWVEATVEERVEPEVEAEQLVGHEIVLVVEDDAAVAGIVQTTLRAHGYRVLYAENGRHALDVAEQHDGHLDLLFTDVVMPEMGGVQLAAELSARRPGLRVLYTSGYTDSALTRRGALADGVQLLQKPYSPAVLAQRVRAALDAPTTRT